MTTPEPDKNLTASQEPDAAAVYLAGIAALEQAATPGPWTLETDRDGEGDDNWEFPYGIRMPVPHTERPDGTHRDFDYLYSELAEMTMATAEFIVAARSAVPRLLGAVTEVLALADVLITPQPGDSPALAACGRKLRRIVSAELLREVPADGN